MEKITQKIDKFLVVVGLTFVFFGVLGGTAHAASLYFFPNSASHSVGSTFAVDVSVSSSDQAMNAVSGIVSFPADKLNVVSLSKSGSIISLWVQEPSFSNSLGTVNFEGISLNPGFWGSAGKIITINFKVRAAGSALLNFSSGSVLANDGSGTNILISLGSGNYSFNSPITSPPATHPPSGESTPSAPSGAPTAPVVVSNTHENEDIWRSNNSPEFNWSLPSGITAISYAIDKKPSNNPSFVTANIASKEVFPDLSDGAWYFHINFKNAFGWGALTHRRVLIDTTPPEPFEITTDNRGDSTHPRPILHFETNDETSGLDHYEVKVGGDTAASVSMEEVKTNPYEVLHQAPGEREVSVRAVDRAGNKQIAFANIFIKPLEPSPIITDHPSRLRPGDALIVRGESSFPNAFVLLSIWGEDSSFFEASITTDENGDWEYVHSERPDFGIYTMSAVSRDTRGALSLPSEEVTIAVQPTTFVRVGKLLIDFLTMLITLIVLLGALIVGVWYSWHRFHVWRRRLLKETRQAEGALHDTFDILHEDLKEQFEMLEKAHKSRKLTREELKIKRHLRKSLSISEKFVKKEIKDIEKELE